MRDTLRVLNEFESGGLFRRYAIGGAIGAIFYIEAVETEDLDIFVLLPADTPPLLPLGAMYAEAFRRGYPRDGPYIIIEGVPVQFLPAYNALVEEAVEQAVTFPYEDLATRVPTAEHLAAIMIQTGRPKDRGRLEQMRSQVPLDMARLSDIIRRHNLSARYEQWTTTS